MGGTQSLPGYCGRGDVAQMAKDKNVKDKNEMMRERGVKRGEEDERKEEVKLKES